MIILCWLLPIQAFVPTLPMLCQTSQARSLWRLPNDLNCSAGRFPGTEPMPTSIQLYKRNHIQYRSPAYVCMRVKLVKQLWSRFFNDENYYKNAKEVLPVSRKECENMQTFKKCVDGPLVQKGDIWQTENEVPFQYKGGGINCCRWWKFEATNCFLYTATVFKRHLADAMESTAGTVKHCQYQTGGCQLQTGDYLRWTPEVEEKCTLLKWMQINGHVMESNFFIRRW